MAEADLIAKRRTATTPRVQHFLDMKRQRMPIVMLTAYDAPTAKAEWDAGVDIILVGDSVGTNVLGYQSEREVQLGDICHHTRAVRRGAPEAFILSDLPYATYATPEAALANARALLAAGANMVKFEGARPEIVKALVAADIAVCCHIGLEPQHHDDFKLKGRSAAEAHALIENARALDEAGMSMLILELVPEEVAGAISRCVVAPVIGIGAGRQTDGQVLVVTDLVGETGTNYRHNKRYAEGGTLRKEAFHAYTEEVRRGAFPTEANVFHMKDDELSLFLAEGT